MDLLIDTNVILDFLLKRLAFAKAAYVFECCEQGVIKGYFTVSQSTDIFYLLRREGATAIQANALIATLAETLQPLDNSVEDMNKALTSDMADYEDALLAQTALRANLTYILTNNLKDFSNSPVTAIGYDEFEHHFQLLVET